MCKHQRMKYCQTVLIVVLFLLGCKKKQSIDNFDSCNSRKGIITGGVNILLKENLYTNSINNTLRFQCGTIIPQPCADITIAACVNQTNDATYISFDHLLVPDICLTVMSSAGVTINTGKLLAGIHNYNFQINGNSYFGQLTVSDTDYVLTIKNLLAKDIVLENDTLHKIPTNTLWGAITYFKETDSVLANQVIRELKDVGLYDTSYIPADYGHFKLDNTNAVTFNYPDELKYRKNFIFKRSGDTTSIKNFVESFATKESDFFQVTVYTSEGQCFRSW